MALLFSLFVAGVNAATLYTNSTSSKPSPTSSSEATVVTGETGPSPYGDPYFRNPFDILVLNDIPTANGTNITDESNAAIVAMESEYAYCSTLWDYDVSTWAATAVYSTIPATTAAPTTSAPYIAAASVTGNASEEAGTVAIADPKTYTQTLSGAERVYTWTASEPCCKSCVIYGGSVEVLYWPTATQKPAVTTLIDSKGFTYTSPSVYVAFESVQASNFCGDIAVNNNAPTLAFDPGELSTTQAFLYDASKYMEAPVTPSPRSFTQANWGTVTKCGLTTTTFWQLHGYPTQYSDYAAASSAASSYSLSLSTEVAASIASHFQVSSLVEEYTISYDPCYPTVSIPSSRFTLTNKANGNVTYCDGQFGFSDPPYALTQGSGFSTAGASTTSQADASIIAAETSTVQPGSTPIPTTATPTTQTTAQPTQTSAQATRETSQASSEGAVGVPSSEANSPSPSAIDPTTSIANTPSLTSNAEAPSTSQNSIVLTPVTQAASSAQAQQITIGSSTIVADGSSAFVISSQTLTAGGQITQSGSVYSLATDGSSLLIAASTTQAIASGASNPAQITIGGSTITADPSSAYVIASQTLTAGGQITQSGAVYSLASNGDSLVIGTSTLQNVAAVSSAASSPAAYVIGSQTLSAGGVATISGTVVSLQSDGSSVVVAGSTAPISQYLAAPTSVIVDGQTQALSSFVAEITGAAKLVSGGTTQAISVVQGTASGASASVIIGGSTTEALSQFLASATGDASVIVGGQTQALSSYIAILTGEATIVVGSKTTTLSSILEEATASSGIAGIIASIGGFANPSTTTSSYVQVGTSVLSNGTVQFTGNAVSVARSVWAAGWVMMLGILGTFLL